MVASLPWDISVFCCYGCQLFSSFSAPTWLADTETLFPEPHLVALPEVVRHLVIGAVASLMSHLDPVPVPIFSSKTTLILALNFIGGLFSFFSSFYLPHELSLVTELYWPIDCSTVCCSCLCRWIFSSHSPLESILSLPLLYIKSFPVCVHSQNAVLYHNMETSL